MLFYETKIFNKMLDKFKLGKIDNDKFVKDMRDFQRFYDSLVLDYYKSKSEDKSELINNLDEDFDKCNRCDRKDSCCSCVIK